MRRRALIAVTCGTLAWPMCSAAQSMKRILRLCFLTFDPGTPQSPAKRFEAFFERLRELGYTNEETVTIDYLHPEGRSDRYPELAAECLHLKPDVIAVTTTPGAHALKNATTTISIVVVGLGDPVGAKLVESLGHPGGNLTGLSLMTSVLAVKRLELLKEAVSELSRVLVLTYLVDPISPLQVEAMKEAASTLGVTLHVIDIRTPDDLPAAFEAGSTVGAQGVLTTAESIFRVARARVTELAARHRLPAVYPFAEIALENGGLMAYDLSVREVHRSVADYVDRILKGAKPTDLPIQQPTVFQLVINLKTAKALGLTLPTTLLARADEVIEE